MGPEEELGDRELPIALFQADDLPVGLTPRQVQQRIFGNELRAVPPVPPTWRERFTGGEAILVRHTSDDPELITPATDVLDRCWHRRGYNHYRMGLHESCTPHTRVFIVQPYPAGTYSGTVFGVGGQSPNYHYKVVEYTST